MDTLPTIHSYTRADAIADGILIDATNMAREAGFKVPVALTAEVWNDCVTWTEEDSKRQVLQDEAGRLWDVLWMAFVAARRAHGDRISFQLYRVPRGGRGCRPRLTTLQLHIGPGDGMEPVITVLLPGQD
ncbi:DUF6573 family protein [Hydrogenophaga flava]|uniref:DUF6573 family protein n=1 Tax=Hydrogenophaga flava TaxID=65657 RepID=UPI000825B7AB|nr:DUF6573 family protein [Hydrogenophaga flava]